MTEFGDALREARNKQGKTLKDLAKATDMSIQYISNIEIGNVPPPSAAKIEKLAEALGEDKEALLLLARRIDAELVEKARKAAPKLDQINKVISFFDSSLKLGEDNPLGGVEGVIELLIGEGMLRQGRTLKGAETVKFMSSLLKQLSEQPNGKVPAKIEKNRAVGRIMLEIIYALAEDGADTSELIEKAQALITDARADYDLEFSDTDEEESTDGF